MKTLRNQIHHDEVPAMRQPGDTMYGDMIIRDGRVISTRNRDGEWIACGCSRTDAADAGLPAAGFAESDVLTPAQREGVANYLGALYGEGSDGTNSKVNLLSKADLYLIVRYNSAIQHAKCSAQIDASAAARGQHEAKAKAKEDEKAEGNRGDAAGYNADSNERAYRKAAADLNAWRDCADAAAEHQPHDHGGLPHRADAHVLGPVRRDAAQGGTRADAEAAYQRSVNDINAWRDGE